ncbi:MAG: hypothetical protein ABJE10_02490, partial [bacterium]
RYRTSVIGNFQVGSGITTRTSLGARMSKYQFAISSGPESVRQAGVVESDSFDEAVVLLGKKIPVQKGDSLEIGVAGFPPARFQCVGEMSSRPIWMPEGLLAA